MSYILEALKKAEEKCEREQEPKLLTFSRKSVIQPKRRPLWPYLIAVALLLNGVAMLLWMAPWRPEKQATPAPGTILPQQASTAPKEPDRPQQKEPGKLKEDLPSPAREAAKLPEPTTPKAAKVPPSVPGAEKNVPTAPPAVQKAPTESLPVVPKTSKPAVQPAQPPKKAPPADKVYNLSDLPPDIRSTLPEFKVSGHAYSPEPQTRVVRVNEKILQEGQTLTPGLKLEEIVPNGLVFTYQGYRFRVGVEANR
jgi:general secretion pathway protein B